MKMAIVVTFGLVACLTRTESAPAHDDSRSPRLYVFDCGRMEVLDLGVVGEIYKGQRDTFVNPCFLLRHPDGDFLWDTGLPDSIHDIEGGIESAAFKTRMPKTLVGQLAEIGLAPSDIEFLSISHSHTDHAGNAGKFATATFIVHEAERVYMFSDEARADPKNFAPYSALEDADTVTFTDEYDVFGDGSARIVSAPGHTPGHSVLLVRLERAGPILLSGDLYHLTEARDRRTVPPFNTDPEETLRSMDRFEALATGTGARVVIQHEDADFASLPLSPDFLD